LAKIAPHHDQGLKIRNSIDTFGNHAGVEGSGQRQDALDDGGTIREQQALDERAIDLERVDGKFVQVTQR